MDEKELYRVTDAMAMLSLGRTAIDEEMRSGRLRSVSRGRSRRIPSAAITEYIALLEHEAGMTLGLGSRGPRS